MEAVIELLLERHGIDAEEYSMIVIRVVRKYEPLALKQIQPPVTVLTDRLDVWFFGTRSLHVSPVFTPGISKMCFWLVIVLCLVAPPGAPKKHSLSMECELNI